ncbi:MAG: 50S ribosomal protein L1 [Deltaproteobacteria bacterium GWC2_42_51]|nr:MAG: 50S ribosomal protein L1 [Deltaproteobacteria bacterium GWB2_42_7]OGP32091.1 MAG: 50S ribosomal protein L1 [Deltaproteobacteria bacterium GWC2_42_51]OGP47930.1 MAG: 50S ribosomal protein L1 [Deltaproteobacteria bacterium GWF2_42_12]OGQ24555.1 MAG: 50S ribosomal protein L1 [Deltaproteobacteria bacterium RIFCSPHIGHO2_02_FULL_42_44]OGQ36577.1 MAG: 50S ribosomal protein L1 [Deltaproteobacteria bacterium RIFCSPLOWO2_02_FULL_42_39]OGQ66326.1 MAG: 50S ribosomal protein L1 [Deltaproteobacteria
MGKNYNAAIAKVDTNKFYNIDDAVKLLPETATAKFDETVDVAVRLGIDPKQSEQMVRGTVVLPNGTGKKVRVLVFAKGEKEKEAKDAGADFVGGEDLVEKIAKGWLDFDAIVATPDMMGSVGKLGKVLGPRGLMPNPKLGTVTFDIARAVKDIKAGKVEFKIDKAGNVHVAFGKISFGVNKLKENFTVLLESIIKAKPSTSKGTYLRSITISTTMGPGIKIDAAGVRETF